MTFSGRLSRTLGLTAAISVAVASAITFGLVRRYAEQDAQRELRARAAAIAMDVRRLESSQRAPLRRVLAASGDQFAIVTAQGVEAVDLGVSEIAQQIDLTPVFEGKAVSGVEDTSRGQLAYVALPVQGPRGSPAAVILARPTGLAQDLWRPIISRVLLAAAVAFLLATAVSGLLARRVSEPLRKVADAADRIGAGESIRLPVEGEEEIAHLARQFNAMADSLDEAKRREREFLANVSHELRTPLTSIRGYAEAVQDGTISGKEGVSKAASVIHDEAQRLEELVGDVLDLARAGAKSFALSLADVDLAEIASSAVAAHEVQGGPRLRLGTIEHVTVPTDPVRLRQIIDNLVSNAMRVTPGDGVVQVSVRSTDGGAVVEVSDTGPGIAAADLPHVFERSYLFRRGGGGRTGLGLAIVRELAEALGATVEVSSEMDKGSAFRVVF